MLLDTASLYFRAFFGVPDTRKHPDAPATNAASGLLDMTARLIREHSPGSVIACWDNDWRPQFRVALVPSYKEHRVADGAEEEMPDPLSEQIPLIHALLVAAGLSPVGADGYEADDVIGTYAHAATGSVDIVSGDRDLFQLVDDRVRVLYTARGLSKLAFVDPAYVLGKYGVPPSAYADMATLRGDPSDGLPGVPGVGEKTAVSLLTSFGSLAGVIAAAEDPDTAMSARIRAKILDSRDYLQRASRVVHVVRDVNVPPAPTQPPRPDTQLLSSIGTEFGIAGPIRRYLQAVSDL